MASSSVSLVQRVSSAVLVSISSSSSALSAYLSANPSVTEARCHHTFDFDDDNADETPQAALSPVRQALFNRFLSGAAYVFQVKLCHQDALCVKFCNH